MSWEQTVSTLNSFLREEIAAVDAYRRALRRLDWSDRPEELTACLRSHLRRVDTLQGQVLELGGTPVQSPGVLGGIFSGRLDGGRGQADEQGDEAEDAATISALEEGEDHGLKHYLDDVSKLDLESRRLIEREILPEQMRTHDSLSDLRFNLTG